jgi:hypothetical protein
MVTMSDVCGDIFTLVFELKNSDQIKMAICECELADFIFYCAITI